MNTTAVQIKNQLLSIIDEMARTPEVFARNPGKDFTRNRILDFKTLLLMMLGMGTGSIQAELLKYTEYSTGTATSSAFIQQRAKLLPLTFKHVLHQFTPPAPRIKRFSGYRLFAVDGSHLPSLPNPKEAENYFVSNKHSKGYSYMHLNALLDLCNGLYVDAVLQNGRDENEHHALTVMVDGSSVADNVILLADRGYESYNNIAHIERKGWKYLFRVKDISSNGILSGLRLQGTSEFDVDIHLMLTRKQTNLVKQNPLTYRFLPTKATFDFIDREDHTSFPMDFRVVRFNIAQDTFEAVITNLDRDSFPPDKCKQLYGLRWGIETAFRSLKHTIGLLAFHSKKAAFITQEVFAALIMYNFCQMIASLAVILPKDTCYSYQINFSLAARIGFAFFRSRDPTPPDIEALLLANLLPIRNERSFSRKRHVSCGIGFNYRLP